MLASLARASRKSAGPLTCPDLPSQPSFTNLTGRVEVPVIRTAPVSTKVLLIYGQSNAISIVNDTSFIPPAGVENYNVFNGKNYNAKDPLLGLPLGGGLSSGSSWAPRLGAKMIAAGMADRVVLVNVAVGGTLISDWDVGGAVDGRLAFAVRSMIQDGIAPDLILQMQGESDAVAGTSAVSYTASARSVASIVRKSGSRAPIFISTTAVFAGTTASTRAAVRLGQSNACSDGLGIFAGPDTDLIDASKRLSDGHFALAALDPAADQWLNVLQSHVV